MVIRPEISSRVPADGSQLKAYVAADGCSPDGVTMSRPGQGRLTDPTLSAALTAPICAIEKTTMMTRYGE